MTTDRPRRKRNWRRILAITVGLWVFMFMLKLTPLSQALFN